MTRILYQIYFFFLDLYSKIQAEKNANRQSYLNPKHVFLFGPIALPNELKNKSKSTISTDQNSLISETVNASLLEEDGWINYFTSPIMFLLKPLEYLLEAFEDDLDEIDENDVYFKETLDEDEDYEGCFLFCQNYCYLRIFKKVNAKF